MALVNSLRTVDPGCWFLVFRRVFAFIGIGDRFRRQLFFPYTTGRADSVISLGKIMQYVKMQISDPTMHLLAVRQS